MVSHAFQPRGDDLDSLSENGVQQLGELLTEQPAIWREQQHTVQSTICLCYFFCLLLCLLLCVFWSHLN
jgi:hypothetical protein